MRIVIKNDDRQYQIDWESNKKAGTCPARFSRQRNLAPLRIRINVRTRLVDLAAQVAPLVRRQASAAAAALALAFALLHLGRLAPLLLIGARLLVEAARL